MHRLWCELDELTFKLLMTVEKLKAKSLGTSSRPACRAPMRRPNRSGNRPHLLLIKGGKKGIGYQTLMQIKLREGLERSNIESRLSKIEKKLKIAK